MRPGQTAGGAADRLLTAGRRGHRTSRPQPACTAPSQGSPTDKKKLELIQMFGAIKARMKYDTFWEQKMSTSIVKNKLKKKTKNNFLGYGLDRYVTFQC